MSANKFMEVGVLVNSCMIGANAYRVLSDSEEFRESYLEEITDTIRQRPGHCYMRACTALDKTELWMVPFASTDLQILTLQDAMEHVYANCLGAEHFHFPFDVVEEENELQIGGRLQRIHNAALVLRPFDRSLTVPFREYLPNAMAPRWQLAKSLFTRVQQLHAMGLTSNGISREQLRVDEQTWEVELWLNHTLKLIDSNGRDLRHEGFCSIPSKTEKFCTERCCPITGIQRDIYSAAILAYYLIMYNHPFLGVSFNPLSRDEYLTRYLFAPDYVGNPHGQNHLGNQPFDREVEDQWERTVPELKALFDGIFMAATEPENNWRVAAPWWDISNWMAALEADAKVNDNDISRSSYKFSKYLYHLA